MLSPFPDQIETIQGFASLRIAGPEGYSRSKFSFLFVHPEKAKIEVFDFLGRTLYQIIIDEDRAFLVVPSKKIYWKSTEEEIMDKFIGSKLSVNEVKSFLSGHWGYLGKKTGEGNKSSWVIKRNTDGKVVQGQKQDMSFQVNEYIDDTRLIRTLDFENRYQEGKLKILSIGFNEPAKESLFSFSFMRSFEKKSWNEIKDMIDHES